MVDTTGASLSTDAIQECMEHGIPISFLSNTGHPYAMLTSPNLVGTVLTRREQLLAYLDERGLNLAKSFVEGKLKNQANLLKYFAKYRKAGQVEVFELIYGAARQIEELGGELKGIRGSHIDECRGQVMAAEGRAGNIYWQAVEALVKDKMEFPGREHRGTQDPLNAMLNYGYGILTQQVEAALIRAGLDVFAGYLHVDRSGKKSLVYDFVEEFRQPVVDRAMLAAVNKGFRPEMEEGKLGRETRRQLAQKVLERLEGQESFQGKKQKIKNIIQIQARRIATFLRGESRYRPFTSGW
ncbi:MAG: CRISPR-associated endonuclease Cas1 [Firmicutes bacterium]|nr:CRISPR-associated endonuclease Cas1 [Bacillota bacterium]